MSLTVLVSNKEQSVRIISWFYDPKFGIEYAHGPMLQIGLEDFKSDGSRILKEHFRKHDVFRIEEFDVKRPFPVGESRKLLKDKCPIWIYKKDNDKIAIMPQVFEQLRLSGMRDVDDFREIELPLDCSAAGFRVAFESALSAISGR